MDLEQVKQEILDELHSIQFTADENGIILKCDTLGSLEAAIGLFRAEGIQIRKAGVGPVTKGDVGDAVAARAIDQYSGSICAFNNKVLKDAEIEADAQGIRIFNSLIIYRVVEDYKEYITRRRNEDTANAISELIMPAKMTIFPQYIFRRSDPLIMGVKVEGGVIVPKLKIVNQDGEVVGILHSIKENTTFLKEAKKGAEVAISITGGVMGRNVKETDVLFIRAPESDIRQLRTKFRDQLTSDTLDALIEYVKVMRKKENDLWAA